MMKLIGPVSDTSVIAQELKFYLESEVANLPKVLSGPQGNVASKTGVLIAVLNGITALRNSRKSQNYIDVRLLTR